MAKILLVNPPLTKDELYRRGAAATASIIPPLGLAYIASYLEKNGHSVEIIDGIAIDISLEDVITRARDFDLVGITVLSAFYKRCVELISQIKATARVPVMAGGAHATAMPESLLRAGADFVILGEGEITTNELVSALFVTPIPFEQIKGLAFLKSGKMITTERRPLIQNLDDLPMPARHLLPMDRYKTSEARTYRHPSHSMVVSRGCQGSCTFCFKGAFGTTFRCHSPKRIVDEMIELRDKYGAKEIAFLDDSFTTSKAIVLEVCRLIQERKLGVPWSCEARIDTIDEEMLRAMKRSGCEFIAYGIESGSNRVLKSVNKRLTVEKITEGVRLTQKVGIAVRGYFMLGFVGETEQEMLETIRFAVKLNPDIATFSLLAPFPGTADYVRAQKEGSFDPDFYSGKILPEFNFPDTVVYSPNGVPPARLLEIHKLAYQKFYYRPSFVLKELSRIRTWQDVRRLVQGAKTLAGN